MLLGIYYKCPNPGVSDPLYDYTSFLNCDNDVAWPSYFLVSSSYPVDRARLRLRASCGRNVNIPVSRSALMRVEDGYQSMETLRMVLDMGFNLRLNSDCSQCVTSGGAFVVIMTAREHSSATVWTTLMSILAILRY
ncbi:unnamed protein product [Arabis nemorensis]|uniref:Wall-associated receptor kinase C-terminal domain-containing protein n=1 Tax=Arabis nemorensis TaxID=586526 RepID=A0A565AW85_9BRAS|nr:unnamed protein product [Arabis nemorensis]